MKKRWTLEMNQSLFFRISLIDALNLILLLIITALYLFSFERTPYQAVLGLVYVALSLWIFLTAWLRTRNLASQWRHFLMFMGPVIFLFAIFESFYMLLPYFNPHRHDMLLAQIDYRLLGVSPTIWLEQWVRPWLTEILYLSYLFYFPMPLIILGWLYKKDKFAEIEQALFMFLICYYGAYITYFFIPAAGPRFFLHDSYTVTLKGLVFSEPIRRLISTLEPNKLDAFPSLHAAILAMTMHVSRRHNKKIFWWLSPVALAILISLLYCRFHYFIDVVIGLLWAGLVILLAPKVYDRLKIKFIRHFRS